MRCARHIMLTILLALSVLPSHGQCEMENTAFSSGETLVYDLYFNWKFVWVKVGSATLVTRGSIYNGIHGYRSSLTTRGNKLADKLFVMRDTLTSVVTTKLVPLYYRKGALEGRQYRVDEVWYTYTDGVSTVRQRYRNPAGKIYNHQYSNRESCIMDMMSMFLRARSFDPTSWGNGKRIHFLMADGDEVNDKVFVYRGKEDFTMESTGATYRCLVVSFVDKDDNGKEKDIITFYITDDENHLPVRLDLNLKFGSAKAFLTAKTGVRHPLSSQVR